MNRHIPSPLSLSHTHTLSPSFSLPLSLTLSLYLFIYLLSLSNIELYENQRPIYKNEKHSYPWIHFKHPCFNPFFFRTVLNIYFRFRVKLWKLDKVRWQNLQTNYFEFSYSSNYLDIKIDVVGFIRP